MARRRYGTEFRGPQSAVDEMAAGRDPNVARRKKGAQHGLTAEQRKRQPNALSTLGEVIRDVVTYKRPPEPPKKKRR